MWYIVLAVAFYIFLGIYIFKLEIDPAIFTLGIIFLPLALFVLAFPVLGFTTGLGQNYSEGQRQGYITKLSHKGLVLKTWEAQMQIGTGSMAALQEPFSFSIPSGHDAQPVGELIGEKVMIHYKQWIIQPYRNGETQYQMISIEQIKGE